MTVPGGTLLFQIIATARELQTAVALVEPLTVFSLFKVPSNTWITKITPRPDHVYYPSVRL